MDLIGDGSKRLLQQAERQVLIDFTIAQAEGVNHNKLIAVDVSAAVRFG